MLNLNALLSRYDVIQEEGDLSDKDFANMMSVNKKMHKKIKREGQLRGEYDEKQSLNLLEKLDNMTDSGSWRKNPNAYKAVLSKLIKLNKPEFALVHTAPYPYHTLGFTKDRLFLI